MQQRPWTRILSLLLALTLVLGLIPAALATEGEERIVTFEEISSDEVTAALTLEENQAPETSKTEPDEDEIVRVSIVVEGQSLLERGYSATGMAANRRARDTRAAMLAQQQTVEKRVSKAIGSELEVVWNLTMAGNIISANVRYGDIEKIAATDGVVKVFLETRYEPCTTVEEGTVQPQSATATIMTGATQAWASGYTGAGSRIAIIDTGLDTDHQSMDNGAYLYALEENAKAAGMSTEDYTTSLNLLTEEEIAEVLPQLNITKGWTDEYGNPKPGQEVTAQELHESDKIAFAYNYIDQNFDVTHDNDSQGGHGSHVAGIATANRFIPNGESGYTPALDSALVIGTAPDAQILVMKVYGKGGGAYDSDYMAAIEDAVLLGADVVNLSLGSVVPGFSGDEEYQEMLDAFAQTDLVMSISSGNSNAWAEETTHGYLYAQDVSYQTGGSPGTFDAAFTVASADNAGITGSMFTVGDTDIVYTEFKYYQQYFKSLDMSEDGSGTDVPYVFLDSYGAKEDYQGEMEDIVFGKVVFVSRSTAESGKMTFSEKHENADYAYARALVIYNSEPGPAMNMSLADSYGYIPCVSITQADANFIRSASEKHETSDGRVYYTGTMNVGQKMGIQMVDTGYYTMSTFSSWGVPGSLTLKPEITAPGGSIYSINGATKKTDQYTIMSGTSMAAPSITGQVALMAQYIRENGLAEKTGLSPRKLAHSLLMSTATPVVDIADHGTGLPYSLLQQGAGLANINDAMNATSYILVDGQPDGKVKAELGDDPDRTGVYTFNYTLHNLTDEAQQYTLDGNVYTQKAFRDEEGTWFADYCMETLNAGITYAVNGKEVVPESGALTGLDFNGDGKINDADGQTLLDYAVGKLETIENADNADLSGDGKVTAYDAELFLSKLGKYTVTLPADGEVTVTVTVTLPAETKAYLDERFENGAYIEGYFTATPFATEEGALASTHSIPMLAFYGNWGDPDMFDHSTRTEMLSGGGELESYISEKSENDAYNYIGMYYGDSEDLYYLGGNNFAKDETYLADRNAIRSNAGDCVSRMGFALIRGAGQFYGEIANDDTGDIYTSQNFGHIYPACYVPNYGAWYATDQYMLPGIADDEDWYITDSEGQPIEEGTRLRFTYKAAPEYFVNEDGSVDWDALDPDAATLNLTATVDNTAPVLNEVHVYTERDAETGAYAGDLIEATVQDNRYVAAVILLTPTGSKVISRISPNQTELGVASAVKVPITGVFGSTFKLAVVDYAGNATYYAVQVSEPYNGPVSTLVTVSSDYLASEWQSFASNTNYDTDAIYQESGRSVYGMAYGDGYLFYYGSERINNRSTDSLYIVDYPGFDGDYTFKNPVRMTMSGRPMINYMTYSEKDGSLYYISGSKLYTLDVATAAYTQVANLSFTLPVTGAYTYFCGMDYSETENCFYVAIAGSWKNPSTGKYESTESYLGKFPLPEAAEGIPTIQVEQVAELGNLNTSGPSLALDESQNAAYITVNRYTYTDIYTYDFATNTLALTGRIDSSKSCLFIDESTADDNNIVRTQPTSITMAVTKASIFIGGSRQLSADVGPWCLADKSVTWRSGDESIATVDENGLVTGVGEGVVTIYAASKLDETIETSCQITVLGPSFTIEGVATTEDGKSQFFTYDLKTNTATMGAEVTDMEGNALPVESVSVGKGGQVLVQDSVADEKGSGYRLHLVDPATGKATYTSDANKNMYQNTSLLFDDIAYDEYLNVMYGTKDGLPQMFFSSDPMTNNVGESWFKFPNTEIMVVAKGQNRYLANGKHTYFYYIDAANGWVDRCDAYFDTYYGQWYVLSTYCNLNQELTYQTGSNGTYQDSMVYDKASDSLVLFHYVEDGTEVYAIRLDIPAGTSFGGGYDANVALLGKIEGFQDIAVYSATYNAPSATALSMEPVEEEALNYEDAQPLYIPETEAAMGATNAVADAPEKEDDGIVTVTLRAEEDAASGMLEIVPDDNMTLLDVTSPAQLSAYTVKNGKVTFGYAGTDAIAKGEIIAVLRLKDVTEPATLTVTETERGGETPETDATVVELGHGWGEWTVTKQATCTEAGEEARICAVCGETETRVIAATGHNWGAWTVTAEADCFTAGIETSVCAACGSAEQRETAPNSEHCPSKAFSDLDTNGWYHESVDYVLNTGLMKGMGNGSFAPDGTVNRAMVVTLLYRLAGEPAVQKAAPFTDVADGAYYAKAVAWAYEHKIVLGVTDELFAPDAVATREQLVTLLYRYASFAGMDVSAGGDLKTFPDNATISAYAREAMAWAVGQGLLKGDESGKLLPTDTATRAELAAILFRFLNN
ncbi:MAG: S8 family serine peptidase [Faecousia sp.]